MILQQLHDCMLLSATPSPSFAPVIAHVGSDKKFFYTKRKGCRDGHYAKKTGTRSCRVPDACYHTHLVCYRYITHQLDHTHTYIQKYEVRSMKWEVKLPPSHFAHLLLLLSLTTHQHNWSEPERAPGHTSKLVLQNLFILYISVVCYMTTIAS